MRTERKNTTKSEAYKKVVQLLLTLICFTAYIFLFFAVIAKTLNTELNHFLLG